MLNLLLAAAACDCPPVAVPAATEKALAYFRMGNVIWGIGCLLALVLPALFLIKGFTGKLERFSHKIGKNWYGTIAVYLILFSVIYSLLSFPLDFYAGFIKEHQFGMSNQTLARWLSQYFKGFGVQLILALAFVWIFYLLMKKSPRRWWFYSALVSTALTVFMVFVQPIWIAPLFNKFGPMKDKSLEKKILNLAERAGIEHSRVFEVDMSQDTKAINAYVTGFGSSKRIVLWDTILKEMNDDQILFVMGHEMGHYVLHHMLWYILYATLLSFVTFYLIYRISRALIHKYKEKLGIPAIHHIASVPLLLLLINFFTIATDPLSNYISRTMEHQADTFGLEITQNNRAAAQAFVILQQKDLGVPYPGAFYTFWRASHPSLGERIQYCNTYCPWKRDQPLEYGKYFKPTKTRTNP